MHVKGHPGPQYVAEPITSFADVQRELTRVAAAMSRGLAREVEFLHVEPPKVFEGLTVGADGTDWNPGAGQGVYTYYNGAWNKLG